MIWNIFRKFRNSILKSLPHAVLGAGRHNHSSKIQAEDSLKIEDLADQLNEAKGRISQLEKTAAENGDLLVRREKDLKEAVAKYRVTLEKDNPEILPELLRGETVEELNGSLEKARALTDKVKKGLEEKAKEIHIPAGAPERAPLDVDSLSSTEKIKEGLSRGRR
jgi:hypothetical protein